MAFLMTRRKLTFNIVLLILSLLWSVQGVQFLWKTRNWIPTTAEITDIALPDGDIFGTYTDKNELMHSEKKPLYTDYFRNGHHAKTEYWNSLIGKKVGILYDPETGQTDKDQRFSAWLSVGTTAVLLSWLLISVREKHTY